MFPEDSLGLLRTEAVKTLPRHFLGIKVEHCHLLLIIVTREFGVFAKLQVPLPVRHTLSYVGAMLIE